MRLFRFEEMWTVEEDCGEIIKEKWLEGDDAWGNIARMAIELRLWSSSQFGNFAKEMRACKPQIGKLMEEKQTAGIALMRALDEIMDELSQEKRSTRSKGVDRNGCNMGTKTLPSSMPKLSKEWCERE